MPTGVPTQSNNSWSIVNVIILAITVLATALVVGKKCATVQKLKISSIIIAIASIIVFALTQNFTGIMVAVDMWTIVLAILVVAQGVVVYAIKKQHTEESN